MWRIAGTKWCELLWTIIKSLTFTLSKMGAADGFWKEKHHDMPYVFKEPTGQLGNIITVGAWIFIYICTPITTTKKGWNILSTSTVSPLSCINVTITLIDLFCLFLIPYNCKSNSTYSFVSGVYCSIFCLWVLSMVLHMSVVYSFHCCPVSHYINMPQFIHYLVDGHLFVYNFCFLWMKLLWTYFYISFVEHMHYFSWVSILSLYWVELVGDGLGNYLILEDTAKQFPM